MLVHKERERLQREKYDSFFKHLEEEKQVWLSTEDMSAINERYRALTIDRSLKILTVTYTTILSSTSLFAQPATTGLVSKHSKYWRFHLTSIKLKRFMSPDFIKSSDLGGGLALRKEARGHETYMKQHQVQLFLEDMIATGKDRENVEQLVEKFTKELDHQDAFEDGFNWYFDYIVERSSGGRDYIGNEHDLATLQW